jgi:hypothetical protein
MNSSGDRQVPPGAPSARLTRHALYEHDLDDLRRRGEPTEGMSNLAPAPTITTEASEDRYRRVLALIKANGLYDMQPTASQLERNREMDEMFREMEEEEQRRLDEVICHSGLQNFLGRWLSDNWSS